MRLSTLPRLLLAAALAGPGAAALAGPVYNITVIGGAGSAAAGINHRGDVVGRFTSGGNTRGFVYTSSGFTEIGNFGGQNSMAIAINDAGQIAAAGPCWRPASAPSDRAGQAGCGAPAELAVACAHQKEVGEQTPSVANKKTNI